MKVLLINPPLKSNNPYESVPFPLGLGYLAAVLQQSGHQPFILDGCLGGIKKIKGSRFYHIGLSNQQIVQKVKDYEPNIVGIAIPFTARFKASLEIRKAIKDELPKIPVIAGGLHASIAPESFIKNEFDAVLLGEAEETFPIFLMQFEARASNWDRIDGIAYRTDAEIRIRKQKHHPSYLDTIPFPAREIVPFEQYIRRAGGRWIRPGIRIASVITSRGCPYKCTYCSAFQITGRHYRTRSPQNVLDEIAYLVRKWHIRAIAFEDDNLTLDRKRSLALFEGMAEKFPHLQWITPNAVSVNHLDRELLGMMKRSGCRSLNLAYESGDPDILKYAMKKEMYIEKGREVRQWCKELGIKVNGYFLLGMPGENPDSLRRTQEYALSLDLDGVGIFIATPFPGTELFENCKEKGYLDTDYLTESSELQSDPEVLHTPLIETPELSKDQLIKFAQDFERNFMSSFFAKRPGSRLRRAARNILQRLGWGR